MWRAERAVERAREPQYLGKLIKNYTVGWPRHLTFNLPSPPRCHPRHPTLSRPLRRARVTGQVKTMRKLNPAGQKTYLESQIRSFKFLKALLRILLGLIKRDQKMRFLKKILGNIL